MSIAADTKSVIADATALAGHQCSIDGEVVGCLLDPETFDPSLGDGVSKDGRSGSLLVDASELRGKPGSNTALEVGGVACEVVAVTDYFGAAYRIEYAGGAM